MRRAPRLLPTAPLLYTLLLLCLSASPQPCGGAGHVVHKPHWKDGEEVPLYANKVRAPRQRAGWRTRRPRTHSCSSMWLLLFVLLHLLLLVLIGHLRHKGRSVRQPKRDIQLL